MKTLCLTELQHIGGGINCWQAVLIGGAAGVFAGVGIACLVTCGVMIPPAAIMGGALGLWLGALFGDCMGV